EYLAREPYRKRRDALWRSQSYAENFGSGVPWRDDVLGRAHDKATGRYRDRIPRDWRLTPIVDQLAPSRAGDLWDRAQVGEVEGLVAVNLAAPIGRRRAKVKCKPTSTIDAVVVDVGRRAATLAWAGGRFAVSAKGIELVPGQVVEVAHDGWYERGAKVPGKSYGAGATPRFARIVRHRRDLPLAR